MSEIQTWKVLTRVIIYDCPPFLRVEKQTVELPDGRRIDNYHFIDMPEYCVVCAITSESQLVLLRGYKHGCGGVTFSLPGGFVEAAELPLAAAKRELREETGFDAADWISMGSYVPHSNYGCGRVHMYRASRAQKICHPNSDDLEESKVEIVSIDNAYNLIAEGEICSLSSVSAISLAIGKGYPEN
jgi:ADP-ribose pyrophosphatase YjhB (NUDIX family)|tara:strand:+ start:49 stop:606 length:558 start_codon:yes stop_codon:yes gene_type:complete